MSFHSWYTVHVRLRSSIEKTVFNHFLIKTNVKQYNHGKKNSFEDLDLYDIKGSDKV